MSFEEAQLATRKLAEALIAGDSSKGFIGTLQEPTPDPCRNRASEKGCRYWFVSVEWTKNGCAMEGPSIIHVDLLEETAAWDV